MSELRSRLIHGFLETCLLSLLAEKSDYGLGLAQRLAAAGLEDLPGGTLYPALLRLEKRGWVATESQPSSSGPRRKYFTITTTGREALVERRAEWSDSVRIVDAIVASGASEVAR